MQGQGCCFHQFEGRGGGSARRWGRGCIVAGRVCAERVGAK